jgi:hypothetical protein
MRLLRSPEYGRVRIGVSQLVPASSMPEMMRATERSSPWAMRSIGSPLRIDIAGLSQFEMLGAGSGVRGVQRERTARRVVLFGPLGVLRRK